MTVSYFTIDDEADLSIIDYYSECVRAAADVLKSAGFNVRLFGHVNIIQLTLDDGSIRYIEQIPKVTEYPSKFEVNLSKNYISLKGAIRHLTQILGVDYSVCFRLEKYIRIRGKIYFKLTVNDAICGYINGNKYMSYDNNWVNHNTYPYNTTFKNIEYDILTPELTPVKALDVDIKNEDFKLVSNEKLVNSINFITIFVRSNSITMGKYFKINGSCPFNYVDESGEKFILTIRINSEKSNSLISADKEIKLDDLKNYKVDEEDGLYNSYEIVGDVKMKAYMDVYCYNYIFFVIDHYTKEFRELEVRKPLSGKRTKAASSFF